MRSVRHANLLGDDHLRIGGLGILQEDLLDSLLFAKVAQCLDTVHNPLVGVFVDRDGHEFRLANADDRDHDQHGLSLERIDLLFVSRDLGTTNNELSNRGRKDCACVEISS